MDGALRGAAKVVAKSRAAIALRLLFPIALLEVALWSPLPLGVLCGVCAIWYITWQLWQAASDARSLGLELRGLLRESWLLGTTLLLALRFSPPLISPARCIVSGDFSTPGMRW